MMESVASTSKRANNGGPAVKICLMVNLLHHRKVITRLVFRIRVNAAAGARRQGSGCGLLYGKNVAATFIQ
jgi:hypothetical protein